MKNLWKRLTPFALLMTLVFGTIACTSNSSIVGYWQDTEQENQYIEFSEDGKVIFDNGGDITIGTYELISENYVRVKFEGLGGAFFSLFGADTWKYKVSGKTLTIQVEGKTATLKRVR